MATKGIMLAAVGWITSIILSVGFSSANLHEDRQLFIVYMGSLPGGDYSPDDHHINMLQTLNQNNIMNFKEKVLVRSYKRSFNGFAAWLTEKEAEKLKAMQEVISVFPNVIYQPLTTRSWDFIGFPLNITRKPTVESDVIVGVIDTGIASDSPFFSDEGFGPIPKKWKGTCKEGEHVVCNKKVIGGKSYIFQLSAPVDDVGHGTHTASTAAGNIVKDASFYNIAKGTARGGVPSARIAAYKVCRANLGCGAVEILASFDDAIADGVDIISVSLGTNSQMMDRPDVIEIGSFHALEKGILTVQAAGNDGPSYGSVFSFVPWVLSVGATTTDRQIVDKVVLGNGRSLTGRTINSFTLGRKAGLPLIYGQGNKSASCNESNFRSCDTGCLDPKTAKGKIVVCDKKTWEEVQRVGGVGVITNIFSFEIDSASVSPLPGLSLTPQYYAQVQAYVNSTTRPTATLLKSVAQKNSSAPNVASFSSRGPNRESPQINKPDLVAPGVEILAGFSPNASLSDSPIDKRAYKFNMLSGTSMACPHVSGAATYVKTFHPDWSPSAIKSALMTSARAMNASAHPDKEFAYGSGLIDPAKAVDPGLIYELTLDDYKNYVCTIYGNSYLKYLTDQSATCPDKKVRVTNFNYPSLTFAIYSNRSKTIDVTFERAVTNVGGPNSTYIAKVTADRNLDIQVIPDTLSFKSFNETREFTVKVSGTYPEEAQILSSSLVWSNGIHVVRSPIVIYKIA